MTPPRRRQAGEGGISEYRLNDGTVRYLIQFRMVNEHGQAGRVRRRGYATRKDAGKALRDALKAVETNTWVKAHKTTVADHLQMWLDGLRLKPSTMASYRKNVRLHVVPHIGSVRLDQLTGARLSALYRQLETSGRRDREHHGEPLSARTVRYVSTIVKAALKSAVADGLLVRNPADRAAPPTAREARAPEMHPWTADQLRRFLAWSAGNSDELHPAWHVAAVTGMRRGELLGLRWADIDWTARTVAVRRSVGVVKAFGEGEQFVTGTTKGGRARVVDLDGGTLALLRAHRAARAEVGLVLVKPGSSVFGDLSGGPLHPERFGRTFRARLAQARATPQGEELPVIRLHDLRHTCATLMLSQGEHPKVVQERLGHATVSITMDVYSHAIPALQRDAADRLGALLG